MDSIYRLGDIVSLQAHPYLTDLTDIVVSGEHLSLPPLLVVTEVYKIKQKLLGEASEQNHFKYKCTWFSVKANRFKEVMILEPDLKLIQKNNINISEASLSRGDKLILKSASLELSKRKSSLTHNEDFGNSGTTTISALLPYISPVLQVADITAATKSSAILSCSWNVKCLFFDATSETFSETSIPIVALEALPDSDTAVVAIHSSITNGKYLSVTKDEKITIVKPNHVSCRSGRYYLRAFDYLLNKAIELDIKNISIAEMNTPFDSDLPSFDIEKKPEAATKEFITKEITDAIQLAQKKDKFIRIRYKNLNDEVTWRTVMKFKVIAVEESGFSVNYLIGHCLLRKAERSFRIDRIQNFQELKLTFAK